MQSFSVDMDSEIDKTGFSYVKTRALTKAIWIRLAVNECTIGPNATVQDKDKQKELAEDNKNFHEDSLIENFCLNHQPATSTPQAKHFKRDNEFFRMPQKLNKFYNVDEDDEKEKFFERKILAELDKLTNNEAQHQKFMRMKNWFKYHKEVEPDEVLLKALEQERSLRFEQLKLEELAKIQETFHLQQQELTESQLKPNQEVDGKIEESKKLEDEANLKLKEILEEKKTYFEYIYKNRQKFVSAYNDFIALLSTEEVKNAVAAEIPIAKVANDDFITLFAKCKANDITKAEVLLSARLVDVVEAANEKGRAVIEKMNQRLKKEQEEKAAALLKAEEEKKKRESEEKMEQDKVQENQQKIIAEVDHQSEHTEFYYSIQENLENVEAKLSNFLKDPSLKKFRNECQQAVNIPVNAISPLDASHLNDKLKKLVTLLKGQTVIISEKRINASSHPLGTLYAMYFLAKKIVKQGEQVVSSKPESAFAIASVVIALWNEMPEFGKLLLAQFYNTCPYLIPVYWARTPEMTEEEYCKKLGFLYPDGEKEELNMFLKRQGGVVKLYGAIIVTPQRRCNQNREHPMGWKEIWQWLTTFISLEPKADVSATLLLDMLEVTGHHAMNAYKCQFNKLLHLICKCYLPLIIKVTPEGSGGPVSRLKTFLGAIISGQNIPLPKGLLSSDFW